MLTSHLASMKPLLLQVTPGHTPPGGRRHRSRRRRKNSTGGEAAWRQECSQERQDRIQKQVSNHNKWLEGGRNITKTKSFKKKSTQTAS